MNKNPLRSLFALPALLAVLLGLCVSTGLSQTTDPVAPAPADIAAAGNFAAPLIVDFAQSHAWLATLIAIVGTLRLVMKPIVTAVEIYVKNSPSTADDAFLEKAERSLLWKVFFWLLDWGASIKAGSQFTAARGASPGAQGGAPGGS